MFTRVLTVAFVAAIFGYVQCENGFAVDMETSRGTHMQFPYFMEGLTSIDGELKTALVQDVDEVLEILVNYLEKQIYEPATYTGAITRNLGIMNKFIAAGKKIRSRRANLKNTRVGTGGTFNKKMQEMFNELMGKSEKITKLIGKGVVKEMSNDEIFDKTKNAMEDLKEAIKASPTAAYVNWSEATTNGRRFVDEAADIMAQLRHKGAGNAFVAVQKLLSVIVAFSG